MMQTLDRIDRAGALDGGKAHELFGRLSFISRKAATDLAIFAKACVLTGLGNSVYQHFDGAFRRLRRSRPELFSTDMSGQPYAFDYRLFAQRNPQHVSARQGAR